MTRASDVFREFRDIYPSDPAFEESFSIARESNNQKSVYILRALDQEMRRREAQGRAAENEPGSLTLEHILPKNPNQNWAQLIKDDPAIREDCTYRLGNMCLMIASENREAGGAKFNEKKKLYDKSNIGITKSLAQVAIGNRRAIEERRAQMAKLAVTAWRFQ